MGKKFKKKARSAHKEKRVSSSSLCSVPEHSNPTVEIENEEVSLVKERKPCNHIDRGVDLDKISWKIEFRDDIKCEDCTDGPAGDSWVGKGRGKQSRKKGIGSDMKTEPKSIWVCLECGHCACGGTVGDSVPQNHALRHARHTRHPCAVQFDNRLLSWCFSCNSTISVGKAEEHVEKNDILSNAQELIKGCLSKGAVMDVKDVWFGGSGEQGKKKENTEYSVLDARSYMVRGLVNLGNTCFFNSVMQNLLAMDLLRAYFMNLERSVGPLNMALKKLIIETGTESDSKSCINPKALFGCICSKASQFRGYQQQDSHELLRYLLDGLHTEELGARKELTSSSEVDVVSVSRSCPTFVDAIFGGQLSSTVCCVECGHSSVVYEPFLDLSLPVPMKKPLSRKAPINLPKKTKLPLKEGNKGGKFREKMNGNVASVSTQSATEVSLPSECSISSCMAVSNQPETEKTIALAEVDGTWLDYDGPETLSDNVSLISQNYDISGMAASNEPDTEKTIALAEVDGTWLDYIGPETLSDNVSLISQDYGISGMAASNKPDTEKTIALAEVDGTWLDYIGPETLSDNVSLISQNYDISGVAASNESDTEKPIASAEVDGTWLDYVEPEALYDNVSLISQNYDISAIEDSGSTQVFQNEDVIQSSCGFLSNACSLNQDKCPEVDLPLCVQNSEGLLLPYKEEVSTTEEIVGMLGDSQNPMIAAFEDAAFKDANAIASSVNGWDQIELEFDGFGDMFNEPETVPDIKTESGDPNFQANEEMDLALLAGNSSESNQDEVDNMNAQVSIDSCLAYFTKPELLSDEHAWNCESCSKMLRHQMIESRDIKRQAVTRNKQSKSLKHQANKSEFMALENGNLTSDETSANTFESSNPHMEKLDDASANDEQKLLNHTEGSNHAACVCGQLGNERDLEFLNPVSNGLTYVPEVSQIGEDLGESNYSPEGISCTSFHDKRDNQVSPGDSHSENIHRSSKDEGIFSKVDQVQKKVPHSSVGRNDLADSESEDIGSESTKVKRDATKTILISMAPSILTIHLKRFSQDARGRLNKLNGHVSFRETLNLWPYMDPRGEQIEKCRYRLVGVVEHSGTMRGGHYVAYVKGARSRGKPEKEGGGSKWFYASDAHAHEVSLTEVLQSEAYILFYEKM